MYLMEAGFTNFDVNYGMLKKHNNDLVVVMNMICNGLVSDSIFEWSSLDTQAISIRWLAFLWIANKYKDTLLRSKIYSSLQLIG